jgi:hypothetical protein
MPVTETAQKVISIQQGIQRLRYLTDPEVPNPPHALWDGVRGQGIPFVEVFGIADEEPLLLTFRLMDGISVVSFGEELATVGCEDILARGYQAAFAPWTNGVRQ